LAKKKEEAGQPVEGQGEKAFLITYAITGRKEGVKGVLGLTEG